MSIFKAHVFQSFRPRPWPIDLFRQAKTLPECRTDLSTSEFAVQITQITLATQLNIGQESAVAE